MHAKPAFDVTFVADRDTRAPSAVPIVPLGMRESRSSGTVAATLRVTALSFTEPLVVLTFLVVLLEALGSSGIACPVDFVLRPVDRCAEPSVAVLLASLSGLDMAGEVPFMIAGVDGFEKVSQLLLMAVLCSTTDGGQTLGDSLT